jgi:hypothetical protein
MTNQNTPLNLTFKDGRQITVDQPKSVLKFSANGIQGNCAIVCGSHGTAVYNPNGTVHINGVPSSAHWLEPGDQIEFSPALIATVDRIGELQQAISELQADFVAPALSSPTPNVAIDSGAADLSPVAPEITTSNETPSEIFKPATPAATNSASVSPTVAPPAESSSEANDGFKPATNATQFVSEPAEAVIESSSTENVQPVEIQPTVQSKIVVEETTLPETAESDSPVSGLAAELLKQIQADEENANSTNVNEAAGTPAIEPTHSPVAGGTSFSSSFVAESTEPHTESNDDSAAVEPFEPSGAVEALPVETENRDFVLSSTSEQPEEPAEPAEASEHPQGSVAALLERMKSEGQWGGVPDEDDSDSTPEPPQPEPAVVEAPTPTASTCDDDVESYMSNLLNRMRGGAVVETPAQSATPAASKPDLATAVDTPQQPIELLRPEEFVPKTKAKRVDGWQGMRELANSQVRTAIDRSQEKKRQQSVSTVQLIIGVVSGVLAIYFWMGSAFGAISACMAVACAICSGFAIYKSYMNVLIGQKTKVVAGHPNAAIEAVVNNPQQAV